MPRLKSTLLPMAEIDSPRIRELPVPFRFRRMEGRWFEGAGWTGGPVAAGYMDWEAWKVLFSSGFGDVSLARLPDLGPGPAGCWLWSEEDCG